MSLMLVWWEWDVSVCLVRSSLSLLISMTRSSHVVVALGCLIFTKSELTLININYVWVCIISHKSICFFFSALAAYSVCFLCHAGYEYSDSWAKTNLKCQLNQELQNISTCSQSTERHVIPPLKLQHENHQNWFSSVFTEKEEERVSVM